MTYEERKITYLIDYLKAAKVTHTNNILMAVLSGLKDWNYDNNVVSYREIPYKELIPDISALFESPNVPTAPQIAILIDGEPIDVIMALIEIGKRL